MTLDLTGCYYRRLDADGEFQVFESTELTASGWGPNLQHGSPPMALLLKAIEELPEPRETGYLGSGAARAGTRAGLDRTAGPADRARSRRDGGTCERRIPRGRTGQRLVIGNLGDGRQGQ